jgi:hypothetical protein
MRVAWAVAVCAIAACVVVAEASGAYWYGATPLAAALATTEHYAAHEVKTANQPHVSYTVGTCRLLHRTPWVGYLCGYELHGVPLYCHGVVTVGVKRLAAHRFRGQELSGKYVDSHGC